MTAKQQYETCLTVMADVTGERLADIRDSRKVPFPTLRSVVYQYMWSHGFTWQEIGRASEHEHSAILLMSRKWENIESSNVPSWEYLRKTAKRFRDAMATKDAGFPLGKSDDDTEIARILIYFGMPKRNVEAAVRTLKETLKTI